VGVILDASVLIAAERETFDLNGFLSAVADEHVAICAITASELLHGVERATDPAIRGRRSDAIEYLLEALEVLPFGLAEARVHARIWAALASKGEMIGAHELAVAATALAGDASVATLNIKEFERVPGLALAPTTVFRRD
jgi:tRNA(fMet)-specific endonuclease VapC